MPNHQPDRLPRGWHSRGYLPHFDDEVTQAVTFRLADSVPVPLIERWREELRGLADATARAELIARIERHLDSNSGACHLRHSAVAVMVESALLFFDDDRYHLHAWVVMPNHVHALFTPLASRSLSDIVGGWKSFTAKAANKILARGGRFWQEDYFDRFIRSESHFADAVEYIENNPMKAGLCDRPEAWTFGSARLWRTEFRCGERDRHGAGGTPAPREHG